MRPSNLSAALNLLMRETERLRVGKIERRREIDREIVTELVLRERHAVAIDDLAARRGDIEDVSARQLLRFVSRDDRLLGLRRRRRTWRLLGDGCCDGQRRQEPKC